jgi:hypothetical protein
VLEMLLLARLVFVCRERTIEGKVVMSKIAQVRCLQHRESWRVLHMPVASRMFAFLASFVLTESDLNQQRPDYFSQSI